MLLTVVLDPIRYRRTDERRNRRRKTDEKAFLSQRDGHSREDSPRVNYNRSKLGVAAGELPREAYEG